MTATLPSAAPPPLIELQNLGFRYPKSKDPALQGVSLSITAGSCFGLLGPNGAGKTTLISILTGMLPMQSGSLLLNGELLKDWQFLKRICALVPQDLAFYPMLTARENLEFFAGLYGLEGEQRGHQIERVASICSLAAVMEKQALTFSGGLKRRLNLAIGLLNQPKLLYLDEPTVGIDAQSRHFILQAIRDLKRSGMTIVYTSHYMEEVQAVCDDIAIIDHGQVVARSSMSALLDEPDNHSMLVMLFREPNGEQLQSLKHLGSVTCTGLQLRIQLRSADVTLEQVMQSLSNAQLTVRQVQYGLNRLEDIYLQYTNSGLRE